MYKSLSVIALVLVSASSVLMVNSSRETVIPVKTVGGSFHVQEYGRYRLTIYYPSYRRRTRLPAVVFAHGLLSCRSWNKWIGERLASKGYIVLIFTVPDRASSDIFQWVKGIDGGIRYLLRENYHFRSPLFWRVNARKIVVMGHSMGAMASIVAAAKDPRVKGAVALAPVYLEGVQTENEVIDDIIQGIKWDEILSAAGQFEKPIQIQVGTSDKLAWDNARVYFDEIPSEEKDFVVIEGGTHGGYLDDVPLEYTVLPLLGLWRDLHIEVKQYLLTNLSEFIGGDTLTGARGTLTSLLVQLGIDNPGIPVEEQHQISLESILVWLETNL